MLLIGGPWHVQGINWVATEIVMTPNPKQRAIVIQRFIEIAEVRALVATNYFSIFMMIFIALCVV
jgi:hypothetical protein